MSTFCSLRHPSLEWLSTSTHSGSPFGAAVRDRAERGRRARGAGAGDEGHSMVVISLSQTAAGTWGTARLGTRHLCVREEGREKWRKKEKEGDT
ncbi:hypothetical protein E2C01_012345 [Portunus trituberculatus]|uniref:Uncharacterized protein n=1 Tax=Portunus trituberculatus TaxID=210409 RepID=A0A5B7DDG7_PORTR|nr:hypothetical protein [Portunus trituberculatus]